MLKDSKDYEPLYDTDSIADVNADKYDEMSDDSDRSVDLAWSTVVAKRRENVH